MEMVAVVKEVVMKDTIRRRDTRAMQIGVEEDVVEEEATDQFIPPFSSPNVTNLVTIRMIITPKMLQLG